MIKNKLLMKKIPQSPSKSLSPILITLILIYKSKKDKINSDNKKLLQNYKQYYANFTIKSDIRESKINDFKETNLISSI